MYTVSGRGSKNQTTLINRCYIVSYSSISEKYIDFYHPQIWSLQHSCKVKHLPHLLLVKPYAAARTSRKRPCSLWPIIWINNCFPAGSQFEQEMSGGWSSGLEVAHMWLTCTFVFCNEQEFRLRSWTLTYPDDDDRYLYRYVTKPEFPVHLLFYLHIKTRSTGIHRSKNTFISFLFFFLQNAVKPFLLCPCGANCLSSCWQMGNITIKKNKIMQIYLKKTKQVLCLSTLTTATFTKTRGIFQFSDFCLHLMFAEWTAGLTNQIFMYKWLKFNWEWHDLRYWVGLFCFLSFYLQC